jgi:hypothetical protein
MVLMKNAGGAGDDDDGNRQPRIPASLKGKTTRVVKKKLSARKRVMTPHQSAALATSKATNRAARGGRSGSITIRERT